VSWQLHIAGDPADPVWEAGVAACHLQDPEDQATARELAVYAMTNSNAETIGDVIGMVERATPTQRRALLNKCRTEAGLDTVEEVERRARFEAFQKELADRPVRPTPTCPACGRYPTDPGGMPSANIAPVRRWWCPEHEHLAEPGDMDAPALPITAGMQLLPDEAEIERERRRDERLQRAQAERNEQRRIRAREKEEARKIHERQVDEGLAWTLAGPGWTS
jgi:hypothetical protein